MSQALDRAGAFRFKVAEHSVNTTRENEYPQWVARLVATEFFDEAGDFGTAGEWVDWSEYEMEIVGYFVLFNHDGPLLNYEQVMKAVSWDGQAFSGLAAMDLSEAVVLGRVEMDNYGGKDKLKVQWIDEQNASVTRSLKALDSDSLKGLDSKFLGKAKAQPAKAPAKPTPAKPGATGAAKPGAATPKPTSAGKPGPSKPAAAGTGSTAAPSAKGTTTAAAGSGKSSAPPKASPKPPAASKPAPEADAPENSESSALPTETTKDEAWEYISTKKGAEVTDDAMADAWVAACNSTGKEDEDEFTGVEWATVRDHAAEALGIPPF